MAWTLAANALADAAHDTALLRDAYARREAALVPYRPEDVDVIVRVNHALVDGLETPSGQRLLREASRLDRYFAGGRGVDGFIGRWIPPELAIAGEVRAILRATEPHRPWPRVEAPR